MFRLARKTRQRPVNQQRFRIGVMIGLGLTLATAMAAALGLIAPLERMALDQRVRHFAYFTPPPSDRITHIDIDDRSLETIGRWPWPRYRMAQVVDELDRAGAAVIAFDVLFAEPQDARLIEQGPAPTPPGADRDSGGDGDGASETQPPQSLVVGRKVEDDALFARSIEKAGNVFLPINLDFLADRDPLYDRALGVLVADMTLNREAVIEQMNLDESQAQRISSRFGSLKAAAMRQRLTRMFTEAERNEPPTFEQCRAAILPNLPPNVRSSPDLDALRAEYERLQSARLLSRFVRAGQVVATGLPRAGDPTVPVLQLARQAVGTGLVTFDYEMDGVVRTIPLWLQEENRLWPHLSLALACRILDVQMQDVIVSDEQTVLPAARMPDGGVRDIVIPMMSRRPGDGWKGVSGQVLVPWPSNARHWQKLFGPDQPGTPRHLPIGLVIELAELRTKIQANERQADVALLNLMVGHIDEFGFSPSTVNDFVDASELLYLGNTEQLPSAAESENTAELVARRQRGRKAFFENIEFLRQPREEWDKLSPQELAQQELIARAISRYEQAIGEANAARDAVSELESNIHRLVDGTACLIGWTGTGAIADFVATSLEAKVPGVMVHGALLNGILTDHLIARSPMWMDMLMIVLIGVLASLAASRLPPVRALALVAVVIAAYFVLSGIVLLDMANYWMDAASPMTAAAVAWVGITTYRFVAEQRDRARITRQFKNYVSPELVDSLVTDPQQIKQGRHELTAMFSDIAGFTSISEKLGAEQTIKLLNNYLAAATSLLMDRRGYVNKYLGDGIMAVWGAPLENSNHALDCCLSMLDCTQAVQKLNEDPQFEGMPPLFMRVGICTGPMMVGDCGAPPRRSDYTVIGDSVNLAARLESANKQFGTQLSISSRTYELVKDYVFTRPIGRIIVVGKAEYETVYELLNTASGATDQQRELAAATTEAVEAYQRGEFKKAIELFEAMIEKFGESKLARLYIENCHIQLEKPAGEDGFDGTITLTTK